MILVAKFFGFFTWLKANFSPLAPLQQAKWQAKNTVVNNLKTVRTSAPFFVLASSIGLAGLSLLVACSPSDSAQVLRWQGSTMGTYYRITVVDLNSRSRATLLDQTKEDLKERVELKLEYINTIASTYRAESELSRFNQLAVGECIKVSTELLDMVDLSRSIFELSAGAYNPLLGPLVNRWGFGPNRAGQAVLTVGAASAGQSQAAQWHLPSEDEVAALLAQANFSSLSLQRQASQLCKHGDNYLDLSGIAKGFAVDELARLLEQQGWQNYLVDIGGELKGRGLNPDNRGWRLAIERPSGDQYSVERVIDLATEGPAVAIATSGDYRNAYTHQGRQYSHTIDARTGYPIEHGLASASVIASSAAEADAWATALSGMGFTRAQHIAGEVGLAVYLLQRDNNGRSDETAIQRWHSEAFLRYLDGSTND